MKKIVLLLLITFLFTLLNSCKKGEDDPAISLRTRKNRATGEWRMTRGSVMLEEKIAGVVSANISYTLTEDSYNFFNSANGDSYTGDYKMTLSIEKEGDMKFSQAFNSSIFQGAGTWDFAGGNGDIKKKEVMGFKMTSSSGESYLMDLFNKSSTFFTYKIKELRNEKMVLESDYELVHKTNDGATYHVVSIYTFEQ